MIDIHFASNKDIAVISELYHQMELYYFKEDAPSKKHIDKYISKNFFHEHCDVRVLLARLNGKYVGIATFAMLYPAPETSGQLFLKDIFTSQAVRGNGVGTAIMKFLARYAINNGCQRFDWTAETDNSEALSYYDSLGAKQVKEKVYFRFEKNDLINFANEE